MFSSNKGLTLIELLLVLTIISVILIFIVPLIVNAIVNTNERFYENQEINLLVAGIDYFTTDRTRMPKEINEEEMVTLEVLINDGYLKHILDVKGKPCNLNSTKVIMKRVAKGSYDYKAILKCDGYQTPE